MPAGRPVRDSAVSVTGRSVSTTAARLLLLPPLDALLSTTTTATATTPTPTPTLMMRTSERCGGSVNRAAACQGT